MKKCLTLIVAMGMISSFASSAVSGAKPIAQAEGSNGNLVYIKQNSCGKNKAKKKSKSTLAKVIKTLVFNGVSSAVILKILDKADYIDTKNIQKNWNNLAGIIKNSSDPKEAAKNLITNPDVMNTVSTAYYTVPTCATFGGILGAAGSFVLGASNIGWLVGPALGVVVALGATGKSFLSTVVIPGASKVIGSLPFGESGSK